MSGLSRTNIRRVSPLREGQSRFESNISSVQNQDAYARARERTEGGLLTSARRQMLNGNQATPPPVAASTPPAVPPLLARPRPVAPAREGRIDGMPASSAIAGAKTSVASAVAGYFNENRLDAPENAKDIQDRDARDRADAVSAARSESSGNPSVTRGDVIDRINKDRESRGLAKFSDDIYKDIAKDDTGAATRTRGLSASMRPDIPTSPLIQARPRPLVGPPASAAGSPMSTPPALSRTSLTPSAGPTYNMSGSFGAGAANPENSLPKIAGRAITATGGALSKMNRKPKGLGNYRTGNPSL